MAVRDDFYQLFYRQFPDLEESRRKNIEVDIRKIDTGKFDFDGFIDSLTDNVSHIPSLTIPNGNSYSAEGDLYDEEGDLKKSLVNHLSAYLKAADAYERQLHGMTKDQLRAAIRSAVEGDTSRQRTIRTKRDSRLFFSTPGATADFALWNGRDIWTIEQATALTLGKNPDLVSSITLAEVRDTSPFRQKYLQRLDRIALAVDAKELTQPLIPRYFINWAFREISDLPNDMRTHKQTQTLTADDVHEKPKSSQIKSDHTLMILIAYLTCEHFGADIFGDEIPIISESDAKSFEDKLTAIGIDSPKFATIKHRMQKCILYTRTKFIKTAKTRKKDINKV